MQTRLALFAVFAMIGFADADVPPSTFSVDGMRFGLADLHFRDYVTGEPNGWDGAARRCAPTRPFAVHVDADRLPTRVTYIDERHGEHELWTPRQRLHAVERLMRSIGREIELPVRVTTSRAAATDKEGIVLRFSADPTAVSRSHGRVVVNLDAGREWVIFHPSVRSVYSGLPEDLVYALRHNFLHALGLGHAIDPNDGRYSIMSARNVYHFVEGVQPIDVDALHTLLCGPLPTGDDDDDDDDERHRSTEEAVTVRRTPATAAAN